MITGIMLIDYVNVSKGGYVMKRSFSVMGALLSLALALALTVPVESYAAEVCATVEGTIDKETTADILHLNTVDGAMLIKFDSDTDYSQCKNLLPGKKIVVDLSYGSDAYMHAVRIKDGGSSAAVTVDNSNPYTIYGTITGADVSKSVIYFKTQQGDMEIKLDPTSDLTGCSVFTVGRNYEIVCARGSDAYLHITSVKDSNQSYYYSDQASNTPSYNYTNVSGSVQLSGDTIKVNGTVSNKSTADILRLETASGTMDLKIDTLKSCNVVPIPGTKVNADISYGNDAYWHILSLYK